MLGYGAFAAIFLAQEYVAARVYLWIAAGGACAAVLVLLALRVMRRSKLVHIAHRSTWLEPIAINLERILRPRREWLALGVYSLLFQSLAGAVVWLAFLAVGADVRIAQAMLITAAAGVASILPISISGLGVVEGAIAGAAVALGVDYDAAVLAALAVRILVTPVSAACGIFLVTSRQ
jgi:uncharacterized membrane protein YbhN (UPF0104 family)